MKKYFAVLLASIMLMGCLAGCGTSTSGPSGSQGGKGEKDPLTGIAYSDDTEYTYLYSSEITTMNYLVTSVIQNQQSLSNFIDTLVEYDAHGNVVPCLAEKWETSEDGLTWTFHLRHDAKWFDCEGNEVAPVTANDFVYAARLIANVDFDSDMPDMLTNYIVNGIELYNKVIDDFTQLGVEAKDDYTLVYHLRAPCAYFVTLLTYGCYLPIYGPFYESLTVENPVPVINEDGTEGKPITNDFGTDRDKILYCGAYICSSWLPQEEYIWVKNENYWDADNVFITKIHGIYNAQADSIAPEMFLRGEIDGCNVTTAILSDWMNGDNAKYVHSTMPTGKVTYMLFDFDPHFANEEDGANYKKAVNNKDFRLSIATGLDKEYSISAYDPNEAKDQISNLMMPVGFAIAEGKDYTEFGELPRLSKGMFDKEKAKEYRDKARTALEAEGVKFPIQIPIYYNPSEPNQDQNCQLIEKQLEDLLGNDYINITVFAGPSTNYIGEVRRPGIWGLFEQGWAPDYADPATFFEPFGYGWTFGSQEMIEGDEYKTGYVYTEDDYKKGIIDDDKLIGKPQYVFNSLVEKGAAETQDLPKRYELFSKAEQFAIEEALFIPYRLPNKGYVADKMSIFDGEYAMAGICSYRYKGRHMLEKSYNMDEFATAHAAWEKEK